MDISNLQIETERLILRPYKKEDYLNWYTQFDNRLPSQYKYDDGKPLNMSTFTEDWYIDWINGFDQSAMKDEMYILGIFRKEDGVNVGKVELITILRMDYQWAMMGYSIHNQFWKKGYGIESVKASTELFFSTLDFHRIELHINIDNNPSKNWRKEQGISLNAREKSFLMRMTNGRTF